MPRVSFQREKFGSKSIYMYTGSICILAIPFVMMISFIDLIEFLFFSERNGFS